MTPARPYKPYWAPVPAKVEIVAVPRDGIDLLGKDCVQHAPQENVEVTEQEEENGRHVYWERNSS